MANKKTQLKIEYVPINSLAPYANNAKIHTGEQIEQIKRSIEQFGMNDPIAVWKDNVIIEGHGRLFACRELGLETVPIIRLDYLTDEERRAYMLVHNKLTMNTDFDATLLSIELDDIAEFDMSKFGFELYEDNILDEQPTEAKYDEKISVVIDCKDENEAENIFNKLTSEGYECHISTL